MAYLPNQINTALPMSVSNLEIWMRDQRLMLRIHRTRRSWFHHRATGPAEAEFTREAVWVSLFYSICAEL